MDKRNVSDRFYVPDDRYFRVATNDKFRNMFVFSLFWILLRSSQLKSDCNDGIRYQSLTSARTRHCETPMKASNRRK